MITSKKGDPWDSLVNVNKYENLGRWSFLFYFRLNSTYSERQTRNYSLVNVKSFSNSQKLDFHTESQVWLGLGAVGEPAKGLLESRGQGQAWQRQQVMEG